MEIWVVNIYVRDMSDFSGCDGGSHIMLSSKFVKFILETIVYGIVNLSFWNSVWKIFMILGWRPGIHVFVADITVHT